METNPSDDRPVDFSEILGQTSQTVSGPVTSSPLGVDPPIPKDLRDLFKGDLGALSLNVMLDRVDALNRIQASMLSLIGIKLGPVICPQERPVGLETIQSFFDWTLTDSLDPETESELVVRVMDFLEGQYSILSKLVHLLTTVQVGDPLSSILEANPALLKGLKGEE